MGGRGISPFAVSSLFPVTLEKGGNKSVVLVAVRALCTLLQEAPHFNYRSNIIETLIPLMTETAFPEVSNFWRLGYFVVRMRAYCINA